MDDDCFDGWMRKRLLLHGWTSYSTGGWIDADYKMDGWMNGCRLSDELMDDS